MAKLTVKDELDYRSGGDRVLDFGAKYKAEIEKIYRHLNDLRQHQQTGATYEAPEDGQFEIKAVTKTADDGTVTTTKHLFIYDAEQKAYVDVGPLDARFGGANPENVLTTEDVAVNEKETYKLVKTNSNGVLPADITGRPGKLTEGAIIQINNLQDGQVLTYRSFSNTWQNENKSSVGDGKALNLMNGSTQLATFSGTDETNVDIGKWNEVTLKKEVVNKAQVEYVPTMTDTAGETASLHKLTTEAEGATIPVRDDKGSLLTATVDAEDASERAANTAFVKNVAAKYLPLEGGTMTGTLHVQTPATDDNSDKAASTQWVTSHKAATATKLATARTIALSGDATGSASFDGSSNITIPVVFVRTTGLTDLIPDNAGAHNSIYRGKSLGSSVTSAQWTAIGSGTFRDLFIGDYWTIGGVNWRIAAFDYWLHCGDTECTTHHVVIVPDTELAACQMNSTNTTTGGYVGSNFYTGANGNTGKATAVNKINAAFGSAHILSHREYLTNAVTNGKPTGTDWYNSTVELMNESMVYGATFFEPNPNGADPWDVCRNYTIDKAQLPLFAHDQSRICNRTFWWLRGVVSPTGFANVSGSGNCDCNVASGSVGVRPAFGIKQS